MITYTKIVKNVFLDLWPNLYIGSWRSHISSFSPIEDTILKLQGFLYTFLELIIYQETIVVMEKKGARRHKFVSIHHTHFILVSNCSFLNVDPFLIYCA